MKYVGVKTTGELRLRETDEVQTDKLYMAVEDTKLGASPIRPYQFVKWDGTKWVKVDNVELATTLDTKNIEDALSAAVEDLEDKIDAVTLDPSAVALGNTHLLEKVTSFPANSGILVDNENGDPPNYMESDALLTLASQNALAGNLAQAFDPSKPNDEGGYAYYKDEIVVYQGVTYRFKVNHSSGDWNSAEVERYDAGESLKFFIVINDPEYLYAITDKDGALLFGLRKDGSVDWQEGVPSSVKKEIARQVQTAVNLLNNEVLSLQNSKVDKETGKSLIDAVFASANFSGDLDEFVRIMMDSNNALLESVGKDGLHKFYTRVSFDKGVDWNKETLDELVEALKATGFTGGAGDWSDSASLQIPMPRFAIINITGVEGMPQTKTSDMEAEMQFWDNNGNYFKKKLVSFNAQGNSSLAYPKKNASFDIVNADESSFKLKFGDWVSQDSFHLKAYFTDFFRGVGAVGYSIYKSIVDTRGALANRTWKLANVSQDSENWGYGMGVGGGDVASRIDDGALCFPMGFPCALYLNGAFYGLFSWQLKKHRDNYNMSKSNANHIHLDGTLGYDFFNGQIDWTAFEVRNPKDLYCMDGTKYDGDNPQELIDPTSASYDANNSKHVKTYQVKQSIIRLSQSYSDYINESTADAKKAKFETYFDVDNLIDYQIFCDVTHNIDGISKNWQWTTWDGQKWYVNAYDLDGCFGANPNGDAIYKPRESRLGATSWTEPVNFEQMQYTSRLNARYSELRSSGVITSERMAAILNDWVLRVGKDFYDLEYSAGHWDDVPCNRDMVVNSDYWELKFDENGEPIIAYDTTNAYNAATSYQQGDECTYNKAYSGTGWYYTLVCLQDCVNKEPITKSGFKDSEWRVRRWLEKNLENMDVVYNFNNN